MSRMRLTYPLICAVISLMAVFGTVVALNHVSIWLLACPTVVSFLCFLVKRVRYKRLNSKFNGKFNSRLQSKFQTIICTLICITPLLFYFYTQWRTSQLDSDSRSVPPSALMIVRGVVLSCETREPDAMRIIIDANKVLYPTRRPLAGKIRLFCFQSVNVLDPTTGVSGRVAKRLRQGDLVSAQINVPRANAKRFPDPFRSYTCKQ
ncbi:MAG TPA: hypothetical protein V6C69_14995, partial [Trichormus sp.]